MLMPKKIETIYLHNISAELFVALSKSKNNLDACEIMNE